MPTKKQGEPQLQLHPIPPLFDSRCHTLILGSFPSVKSREQGFYYGHPQNRFWRMLAGVYGCELPQDLAAKKQLLLSNGLALWDVIASCRIVGSSDSSISDVCPNDLSKLLEQAPIRRILLNGKTAERCYLRYQPQRAELQVLCLPSTSPANAASSLQELIDRWSVLRA